MVVPCFECGDDVVVDEDAEIEAALCTTCIATLSYWDGAGFYADTAYSGISDYDGYQYQE